MVPRTEFGAVEKLWRVRCYLNRTASYDRSLTFEQLRGFDAAMDITYAVQRLFWEGGR
jgi:hypothetical protein